MGIVSSGWFQSPQGIDSLPSPRPASGHLLPGGEKEYFLGRLPGVARRCLATPANFLCPVGARSEPDGGGI